jgi:hypothetical protein
MANAWRCKRRYTSQTKERFKSLSAQKTNISYMKFPPFGQKLYESLCTNGIPKSDVYIFVGDDLWEKTKLHNYSRFALYLPPSHVPDEYTWPVTNCTILIFDVGNTMSKEQWERFAYLLFEDGANLVHGYSMTKNGDLIGSLHVWRKEN